MLLVLKGAPLDKLSRPMSSTAVKRSNLTAAHNRSIASSNDPRSSMWKPPNRLKGGVSHLLEDAIQFLR